jgi:hypothetical protein
LKNVLHEVVPMLGLLSLFELLFPVGHLQSVVSACVNKHTGGQSVTHGEFLHWLGLWFLVATTSGCDRRAFCSTDPVDRFGGAPFRLNDLMSRCPFEAVLQALAHHKDPPPAGAKDPSHWIRGLQKAWNDSAENNFDPGWES